MVRVEDSFERSNKSRQIGDPGGEVVALVKLELEVRWEMQLKSRRHGELSFKTMAFSYKQLPNDRDGRSITFNSRSLLWEGMTDIVIAL
jgi:hypothetical protein